MNYVKKLILSIMLMLSGVSLADTLDSLRIELEQHPQVQEKIYVHTDNTCYFIGDTIWYKAYVLRSDDLLPTDMSKILYVELLSADGLVVERQQVIVSGQGYTCGDFVLQDSLYSGYYEIRAYTRYQLNFNVGHKGYSSDDARRFYNRQIAHDFFRNWEGLYSRVLPVYAKPQTPGDYEGKYMYPRPKQEIQKAAKENLTVKFYPEGGAMVQGHKCRIAFEAQDQEGQNVSVKGSLDNGTTLQTDSRGRGVVEFTPSASKAKASFTNNGKTYSFDLPEAEATGITIAIENGKITVTPSSQQTYALALCCRGMVYSFEKTSGTKTMAVPCDRLPTGVCEAVVYDAAANPVASRLFFVNNHDVEEKATVKTDKLTAEPYDKVMLTIDTQPTQYPLSVAVRDASTDDLSYDDGNMLTDLLLSSELRGFIPNPAYYFEKDDKEHQEALDLLMMVQGWRKYKRLKNLRYEPERTFTIDGTVYKMLNVVMADDTNISDGTGGVSAIDGFKSKQESGTGGSDRFYSDATTSDDEEWVPTLERGNADTTDDTAVDETSDETVDYANNLGDNTKNMKKQVLVEAEVTKNGETAGTVLRTDNRGNFMFEVPPFYGDAILFMRAYNVKDSLTKRMGGKNDKDFANERAYPDYYVKRNLFFPIFSQPFSYYQTHEPMIATTVEEQEQWEIGGDKKSKLDGDHVLQNVNVKGKKRGRRRVDYNKPSFVMDAYEMYNYVTDYGLSYGVFDLRNFPLQVSTYLYGNMERGTTINIRGLLDGTSFYRNYAKGSNEYDKYVTSQKLAADGQLKRLLNVRAFSDYEPRTGMGLTGRLNAPDVTLILENIPDDGKQYTYRDRRIVLHGFYLPDEYYSPDYSQQKPSEPKDYRRTLYWNPNVKLDANGHFETTFYGNSKETRMKVSVAGVTETGKIIIEN